ncbi:MAG TPA: hypothetical protein VEA16_08420 [Vicinamibacterales bacterium]|nr:hypothetical protein [Vicinamibacterales bacterium]
MRPLVAALVLTVAACSGSPGPAPTPVPTGHTLTITLTDTITGAIIGTQTQQVTSLPAQLALTAPGYVRRDTWARSPAVTVDLIPEGDFDLGFYRQFARNGLEAPGSLTALRVLSQSPSIYVQRVGLSDPQLAAMEAAARDTVTALTGGRLHVVAWETGPEARAPQTGWITAEVVHEPDTTQCGRALVGAPAGRIWLNVANPRCAWDSAMAHEVGHALGFHHVDVVGALMRTPRPATDNRPSALERHHAAIAYARQRGNMDVDTDPLTSALSAPMLVVD